MIRSFVAGFITAVVMMVIWVSPEVWGQKYG